MKALARRPPQPLPHARQPAGDGSRRSAPPTSRDDNRWPRAATRERCAAHASHAMLGAARAPRQPAAAKRSTRRQQCRRAHAATCDEADESRAQTAIGGARRSPEVPPAQPRPASARHKPSRSAKLRSCSANASPPQRHLAGHAARWSSLSVRHHMETHSDISDRLAWRGRFHHLQSSCDTQGVNVEMPPRSGCQIPRHPGLTLV